MVDKTPLNPLVMVMAINDDIRFTPSERVALIRAVKHTDNASRQVRMSQVGIAEGAGVSRDTVKRAFAKAFETGYFSGRSQRRNEKGHKVTDYRFRAMPPQGAREVMDNEEPKVHAKVQEKSPSTSSTTSPISLADSPEYPCFGHGIVGCACDRAAEVEVCDLHSSFAKTDCPFLHEPQPSNLSPVKQQRLHERDMAKNESMGPYGDPLDRSSGVGRYSGRNRP